MPTTIPIPSTRTTAADKCSGTAKNKAFFVEAAAAVPFPVYCAVLPSDWWISSGDIWPATEYNPAGIQVDYENGRGFLLTLRMGGDCDGSCRVPAGLAEAGYPRIWFGDRGAYLIYTPDPGSLTTGLITAWSPGTDDTGCILDGWGMSKATFVKIAAAMVRVSKP
jgi:hypothetical protein